ncbi:MAG: hypothetical protein C7B47_08970 [Sulfobacillus thermosulfidooxidans]|uniref:Uncharacterized protein n=1 Tax=Sulfobacillus thermosulfidooxidans TaxID=28034 RepID=A0A2T2WY57_SULTH|nr:MAG: hypothetical protein C7B47_08970 [Sulfobacillus thermosulfidooxidans]
MIIYWYLGHIVRSGHILQEPYIVVRDHVVFDVDRQGWDLGIHPNMPVEEIKWHYPQAKWIPWRSEDYQQTYNHLSSWLEQHTISYRLEDVREGYWQQSEIRYDEWRQLIKELVPRWALRIRMGISIHPLLSRWISLYGEKYPQWVERWQEDAQIAYVLPSQNTERMWEEIPLKWFSHLPVRTIQEWKRRGWEKVGDVPHVHQFLQEQKNSFSLAFHKSREPIRVTMGFEEPLQQGFLELIRYLAEKVGETLQKNHQGSRYFRIIWQDDQGIEVRERKWPLPTQNIQQVVTRFLSLVLRLPSAYLERVTLEAHHPEALNSDQLMWWASVPAHHTEMVPGLSPISRRDQLLQYWDPWRRTVAGKN